jgi:osmotically-inducible protein OsmY
MKTTIAAILISLVSVFALSAHAEEVKDNSALQDAWLDGKLDTVILLNRNLNPLKIDTDVTNGIAVLAGEVDSEVEKSLAAELAKGIDGISEVKNHIQVKPAQENADHGASSGTEKVASNVTDAAITTAISTKLLLNTEIDSTAIDIDTDNSNVKISGSVESRAERDLVEQIAKNTFEVTAVTNNLAIRSE